MTDLITSLRALAAARHDDLSIAVDAVIEIERLRSQVEDVNLLKAEITLLREALVLGSEVLASHQGSAQREWHSVGAWLYPGDSINVVCAPLSEIKVEP